MKKKLRARDDHCLTRHWILFRRQCDVDGDIEYEFPCYNFTESLEGLWSTEDTRYNRSDSIYGGVLLKAASTSTTSSSALSAAKNFTTDGAAIKNLLWLMFPRIQSQLRRHHARKLEESDGPDLYQWFRGSKYCLGTVER